MTSRESAIELRYVIQNHTNDAVRDVFISQKLADLSMEDEMRRMSAPRFLLAAFAAISLLAAAPAAFAQPPAPQNPSPCDAGATQSAPLPNASALPGAVNPLAAPRPEFFRNPGPPDTNHGLVPADWGLIVYDENQGVCWLANANLAGDPLVRAALEVDGINPDGTMDYATALLWVDALNSFDHGHGVLGHNNWQLPATPLFDPTSCSSSHNGTFGLLCSGSGLGNLYNVGLDMRIPNSVVPDFTNAVGHIRNLQPGLYWTADRAAIAANGQVTFSFNTGINGSNTTTYNYLHVLPVTHEMLGTPASGSGVVPYTSGDGAGKAVYDTDTQLSWPVDANLAPSERFGVKGDASMGPTISGDYLSAPLIDADGTMLFSTIESSTGWLTNMNASTYAGSDKWKLPTLAEISTLYQDLNVAVGDMRLETYTTLVPFYNLQPGFYWSCERDQTGNSQSPCDPSLYPSISPDGTILEYTFNFDNGFEGTDLSTKEFYVMVYYPAPAP